VSARGSTRTAPSATPAPGAGPGPRSATCSASPAQLSGTATGPGGSVRLTGWPARRGGPGSLGRWPWQAFWGGRPGRRLLSAEASPLPRRACRGQGRGSSPPWPRLDEAGAASCRASGAWPCGPAAAGRDASRPCPVAAVRPVRRQARPARRLEPHAGCRRRPSRPAMPKPLAGSPWRGAGVAGPPSERAGSRLSKAAATSRCPRAGPGPTTPASLGRCPGRLRRPGQGSPGVRRARVGGVAAGCAGLFCVRCG
jgi:hypothetical protein